VSGVGLETQIRIASLEAVMLRVGLSAFRLSVRSGVEIPGIE